MEALRLILCVNQTLVSQDTGIRYLSETLTIEANSFPYVAVSVKVI